MTIEAELKNMDAALWRARAAAVRTSDHHIQIGHAIDAFGRLNAALAKQAPPPECQSEAEKTAFAFGWLKAMEAKREQGEPVAHDEDWLERMYWEFDAARAKSGEERLRFKGFMRAYGTRCAAPQQRKSQFKEFVEWANSEGYDTAHAHDGIKWICLNPMTNECWKAWQAAHGTKEAA